MLPAVKRTICKFFLSDACERGALCTFAHGEHELGEAVGGQAAPQRLQQLYHEASQVKRTLCKFFLEGHCERGALCGFAHSDHDIGQPVPDRAPPVRETPAPWRQPAMPVLAAPPVLQKRTMCKFFLEGSCDRGNACGFAHGEHEFGQPVFAGGEEPVIHRVEPVMHRVAPMGGRVQAMAALGAGDVFAGEVKRTICKFYAEGTCSKGRSCGFAHGNHEIGQPVHATAGGGIWSPAMSVRPQRQAFSSRPTRMIEQVAPVDFGRMAAPLPSSEGLFELELEELAALGDFDMSKVVIKRTICKFWSTGCCNKGDLCGFAHGEHEIGEAVLTAEQLAELEEQESLWQASAAVQQAGPQEPEWVPGAQPSVKRTLCKFFMEGACQKGLLCGFAHGEHDIGRPVPTFQESAQRPARAPEPPKQLLRPQKPAQRPPEFQQVQSVATKRTMCRFYMESTCWKGAACGFAHSAEDFGQPVSASSPVEHTPVVVSRANVKRTLCSFWQKGICMKGEMCDFTHGEGQIASTRIDRPAKRVRWDY